MATAWCRNTLRKQEARGGGENVGGFLKEAPKPQELFLNLSLTEPTLSGKAKRNRCSKVNSMPPGFSRRTPCKAGSAGNTGGQAPAGCLLLRFSLCRKRFSAGVPAWQGQPATPGGKPSPGACFSGSACAASDSVPGYLHGKVCKCRKRSNAGVPGAVAPGKIILESPPSPPGKGVGEIGGRIKN